MKWFLPNQVCGSLCHGITIVPQFCGEPSILLARNQAGFGWFPADSLLFVPTLFLWFQRKALFRVQIIVKVGLWRGHPAPMQHHARRLEMVHCSA